MKRTLYVSRPLLNGAELLRWATALGLTSTLPADDLHTTICFSRTPMEWDAIAPDTRQLHTRGGKRLVKQFGKATVLRFDSQHLSERWWSFRQVGASYEHPSYQPHVTFTFEAPEGFDPATAEPFAGELRFGPERFKPVKENWKAGVKEQPVRHLLPVRLKARA